MLSTLVHFVLAYEFVLAFRFYERDEHRLGAPVGRQLAPECERAHIVLFLGFRMVELGIPLTEPCVPSDRCVRGVKSCQDWTSRTER